MTESGYSLKDSKLLDAWMFKPIGRHISRMQAGATLSGFCEQCPLLPQVEKVKGICQMSV
jgi:hypothetical protein